MLSYVHELSYKLMLCPSPSSPLKRVQIKIMNFLLTKICKQGLIDSCGVYQSNRYILGNFKKTLMRRKDFDKTLPFNLLQAALYLPSLLKKYSRKSDDIYLEEHMNGINMGDITGNTLSQDTCNASVKQC